MKSLRFLSAALAACILAVAAFAASGDPSGTWKWTISTPNGDIESTATLTAKDGQVSGTYSNSYGESQISNGTVKDGVVAFSVVRDMGGNQFTIKYQGTLSGDTIKGTVQVPGMDGGESRSIDWTATRVQPAKP